MTKPFRSLASLLVCLAALSACTGAEVEADDPGGARILDVLRYEMPMGSPPVVEGASPLVMSAQGEISYEGEAVAHTDLDSLFARMEAESLYRPALKVDPQAQFANVLSHLPAIAAHSPVELEWEEETQPKVRTDNAGLDVFIVQGFAGIVTPNEVGLRVGYSADADQCALVLDDKAVSSKEAYDHAFIRLDELVAREGGPEVVVADPDLMESIVARIQSDADTPWRCFGGAVQAVKNAGWPAIQFEVVAD